MADALAARAARLGRSPEAEAAAILRDGLRGEVARAPGRGLTGAEIVALARELFGPENGVDLDLPARELIGEPRVRFD